MNNIKINFSKPYLQSVFFLLLIFLFSCGYKFYDASIPPEVKTIRINNFINTATLINPSLALRLQREFIDKIQNQTKLRVVSTGNADYEVSGNVTAYNVTSSNIGGDNRVTKNLLTLGVTYSFVNNIQDIIKDIKNTDIPLTTSEEFDATQALSGIEGPLIDKLAPQITNQAFNKIFSSW